MVIYEFINNLALQADFVIDVYTAIVGRQPRRSARSVFAMEFSASVGVIISTDVNESAAKTVAPGLGDDRPDGIR
jgi:hypothetical protein